MIMLFLVILALVFQSFSRTYRVIERVDQEKTYNFSTILQGENVIAKACLVDPEKNYHFFSRDSDPAAFRKIEDNYFILAESRLGLRPLTVILADFTETPVIKKNNWSFKYFFNYLGVLIFSPPYLKKFDIVNPAKTSSRFFIEVQGKKAYYGLIVFEERISETNARNLLKKIGIVDGENYNLVPVFDYFPIKFVVFRGGTIETLYESKPGHKRFDCLFMTGGK